MEKCDYIKIPFSLVNYNILALLLIALLAWTFILIWFSKKTKQERMKRQQLLAQIKEQFPIPSFKELLLTLEALNYDPSWCCNEKTNGWYALPILVASVMNSLLIANKKPAKTLYINIFSLVKKKLIG